MGETKKKFDYDVAVLGGGSGGYAAARTATSAGLSTVVVEGGTEVGGLCILRGCMPTKTLLYAAEVAHLARQAPVWGVQAGTVDFDWQQVTGRKETLIREFADYRANQLTDGQAEFVRAMAQFQDPHTLALSTGEQITAAHFIISTGSAVSSSPLPQLGDIDYITSDDALALKKLPKSMIILGGGAIAIEFAQLFARFDVQVTLIQRSPQLLRDFDVDAAKTIEKVFRKEGITVYTDTQLLGASRSAGGKQITFLQNEQQIEVEAEEVLFALGRSPNTTSLQLDKAGVDTKKNRILTNAQMQTSTPHIYAAGDCTGPHEIVHIAIQQGEIAALNIANPGQPRSIDYRLLINVVFTDPQLATVGLSEKRARALNIPYLTANYSFDDHGKSLIMEARDGFVKLLADPNSGEILGGAVVGPVGGELIHEIVTAMAGSLSVHALAATPHYHPTLAEIWTYPAEELADQITLSR